MAAFFPVPKEIAKNNPNWAFSPETFVGNGPFNLKSWTHTDEIRGEEKSYYWQANQVSLNEVSFVMVSRDTEIQMFEAGKLDLSWRTYFGSYP